MPHEAAVTGDLIFGAIEILKSHPAIGRPLGRGLRELVISRGKTGYLALYLYEKHRPAGGRIPFVQQVAGFVNGLRRVDHDLSVGGESVA